MARPRSRRTYNLATDDTIQFNMPQDLTVVEDAELAELLGNAQKAFDAIDDEEVDASTVEVMTKLADAVEAIRGEQGRRAEERARAKAAADEIRSRIADEPVAEVEADEAETADEPVAEGDEDIESTVTDEEIQKVMEEESVVASGNKPFSIKVPAKMRPTPEPQAKRGLTLVASADLPGIPSGSEVTLRQAAEAAIDRSRAFNLDAMRRMAAAGKRTVQSFSLGTVHKEFPDDLKATKGSDVDEVLKRAVDTSRLPGGSLVASSGWCSPSEVLYELAEDAETTEGLFSLPEIQVDRGGLKHTLGPDFQSIFTEDTLSWNFTEAEVEAGDYDGYGGGTKPCYFVPCPDFVEDRLDVAGICIRAGLLMNTAYPEVIERLVSGALVAHEFKQARRKLEVIQNGSTAVAMPANPMGAISPILDSIELQVEDYKQRHRIGRGRSLEAVFPFWVRGAIRSDLSRRLGVDMLSVTNEQINGWFTQRGVNAQFVYELDDLTGNAASRTSWPTEFKFLMYLEGTWIGGTQAVITLENVFDSALVEQNIYTQLFTEEGWLVAKRFHDSRLITVNICPDGMTRAGFEAVTTGCDGSAEKSESLAG